MCAECYTYTRFISGRVSEVFSAFSGTQHPHEFAESRKQRKEKRREERKKYLGGSWHHHRRRVLTISAHFSFSFSLRWSLERWCCAARLTRPNRKFFLIAYNIFFTLSSCPSIFVSFFLRCVELARHYHLRDSVEIFREIWWWKADISLPILIVCARVFAF